MQNDVQNIDRNTFGIGIAYTSLRMFVHSVPLRVLLVDDDRRSTNMFARMLREDGFEVDVATDGTMALQRINSSPDISILVTDLRMPFVDGVTLVEYVYTKKPSLPVLIITSYLELFASQLARLVPHPTVLTKPIRYSEVRSLLHTIGADGFIE